MIVNNSTVSKTDALSISEVSGLVGAGTNDLGTLCKHPNINPYSKYKPVRKAQIGTMEDADFKSVNWGYYFPVKCNLLQCIRIALGLSTDYKDMDSLTGDYSKPTSDAVDMGNAWYYLKPTGGASSPYRLGDFRGYNHNTSRTICTLGADLSSLNMEINVPSGEKRTWSFFTGTDGVDLLDLIGDYTKNGGYNRWGVIIIRDSYNFPSSITNPNSVPAAQVHFIYSKAKSASDKNYPSIIFGEGGDVSLDVLKSLFWDAASGTKFKVFPILVNDPVSDPSDPTKNKIQYEDATTGKNLSLTNACVVPFNEDVDNMTRKGYITIEVTNTQSGSGGGSGSGGSTPVNVDWKIVNFDSGLTSSSRVRANFDLQAKAKSATVPFGNTAFVAKITLMSMNESVTYTTNNISLGTSASGYTISTQSYGTILTGKSINYPLTGIQTDIDFDNYKYKIDIYYQSGSSYVLIASTGTYIYQI